MSVVDKLVILGCGGHARSVADVAILAGVDNIVFVDANARPNEKIGPYQVVAAWDDTVLAGWSAISAAGDSALRSTQLAWLREKGIPIASVVAPSATVGLGATVAEGVFIGNHAHVGPFASIGTGAIVNTGAVIEHEVVIGDYTHVSIHASVAGRCKIGSFCFIGAGSTVIDSLTLCAEVTLGAGGCLVRDVALPGTYVGVPARNVRSSRQ